MSSFPAAVIFAAASIAASIAGCSFSADFGGTSYRCGAGDTCPVGYDCVAGVCVLGGGEDGGGDDDGVDAPTNGTGTWRSDSESDFGAGGPELVGAVIAPRGAIEPVAYYTGGVLVRAHAGSIASAAVTWDQVTVMAGTSQSAIARSTDVAWGSTTPPGVGLSSADAWTLRFEGEVWLDAGSWTFFLTVDDRGFVEVAGGGAATFARVASATYPTEASGTVQVASAGWYPLRWVASDVAGAASMRLRFQGPGVASPTAIPRHRLRVRADQLEGMVMTAFAGELMAGNATATTIDTVAPAGVDWVTGGPGGVGLNRVDDFSVRWSGQLRVDGGGIYYLRYASDDGQRMWVDGVKVLDAWDSLSHERVTPPLDLSAGWHDVVIDVSEHVVTAKAMVVVDSGPELTGQTLPVDRLRPVEGRAERHENGGNAADIVIPDAPSDSVDGVASSTFTVTAPPGAVVRGLELGLVYDHEWLGDLRIQLVAPSGRVVTLRNGTGNTGGTFIDTYVRTDLDGEPVAGTWTVRFTDIDPQGVGTIRDVQLTVHTSGAGEPPITMSASYASPPYDLGGVATLTAVRWQARTPAGTAATVRVRTCATAADCAGAAWSAALPDPAGSVPAVPAQRFAQYRIELSSTGDAAAALESIEIDYRE